MPAELVSLPSGLAPIARELVAFARACVEQGAGHVSLSFAGRRIVLAGDATPAGDDLRASLTAPGVRGDLLVGRGGTYTLPQIQTTTDVLGRLATREHELRQMTTALIESNDQILALYELATSSATSLAHDDLRSSLAAEALRLSGGAAVAILEADGAVATAGAAALRDPLIALAAAHDRAGPSIHRRLSPDHENDVAVEPLGPGGGVLAVASHRGQHLPTPTRKLVDAVASHVGGLLHLAAVHDREVAGAILERDVETAGQLASQILPTWEPEIPGIELAARSYPARLASGDYYTYAATTNGLMFAVGDVSGKGLSAALVMTMVSSATTAATNRDVTGDPARILADVSADVYDYLSDSGVFVTTAIGVWDAHESTLKVANAGHSPVLHCHGDRTTSIPPAVPPLGVLPDVAHEPIELVFEPGDALLFGSDGLAEQEDAHGRQLGYDALDALLISHRPDGASALVDRLFDAVERHGAGQPQDDDRTALVVARREGVT